MTNTEGTIFSYGDRKFKVDEKTYRDKVTITITSTRGEGMVNFGYVNRDEGVAIIQSLANALGLSAKDIFPAEEAEAVHPSGAKVGDKYLLTGPGWDGAVGFPKRGTVVTVSRVDGCYPKFNARPEGPRDLDLVPAGWVPEGVSPSVRYLTDWAAIPYVEPKNARDIIEALEVGATFTLTRSEGEGAGEARHFRKDSDTFVGEYEDDTFRAEKGTVWDLTKFKGLFTGWAVDEFAEVEPRKVNENREVFDALPIGGKFKVLNGWGVVRIKIGADLYVVEDSTHVEEFDSVFPETFTARIEAIED